MALVSIICILLIRNPFFGIVKDRPRTQFHNYSTHSELKRKQLVKLHSLKTFAESRRKLDSKLRPAEDTDYVAGPLNVKNLILLNVWLTTSSHNSIIFFLSNDI